MTLMELRKKDVIQMISGVNLGRVDDLRFDRQRARLEGLILLGRPKLFGLLGYQENLFVPWEDIELIGVDTILVHTVAPTQEKPSKENFFEGFFS